MNGQLGDANAAVQNERQDRLRQLMELDRMRKEAEMFRGQAARFEMEKNTYFKAFNDLKKQRDQAGVQRM